MRSCTPGSSVWRNTSSTQPWCSTPSPLTLTRSAPHGRTNSASSTCVSCPSPPPPPYFCFTDVDLLCLEVTEMVMQGSFKGVSALCGWKGRLGRAWAAKAERDFSLHLTSAAHALANPSFQPQQTEPFFNEVCSILDRFPSLLAFMHNCGTSAALAIIGGGGGELKVSPLFCNYCVQPHNVWYLTWRNLWHLLHLKKRERQRERASRQFVVFMAKMVRVESVSVRLAVRERAMYSIMFC